MDRQRLRRVHRTILIAIVFMRVPSGGNVVHQKQGNVTIWRAQPSSIGAAEWRALARLLDAAEQAQAARLRFAADRCAYVLAHGIRRLALAQLLGLPAAGAGALRFDHDVAGRPFLAVPRHVTPWFFSHAHAREGVLFAASREHPVGIDLEPIHADREDPALLRHFLTGPTDSGLDWSGPDGFAQGWTALESFVKALGCGLPGLQHVPPVRCTSLGFNGRHLLRLSVAASPYLRRGRHRRQEALVLRPTAPAGCAAALAVRQGAHAPPPQLHEYRLDTDLLGRL